MLKNFEYEKKIAKLEEQVTDLQIEISKMKKHFFALGKLEPRIDDLESARMDLDELFTRYAPAFCLLLHFIRAEKLYQRFDLSEVYDDDR